MSIHSCLVATLVSLLLVSSVQTPEDPEARAWRLVREYYDTVVQYRQGQIDAALERLKALTPSDQLSIAGRAVLIVEGKKREIAMLGDDAKASSMLTPLPDESAGAREAYLSRLLLSRVQIRARQFDDAARTLDQAAKVMPSGQSAYVGLAYVNTQQSNPKGATDALQRMLMAPHAPDDPWVTYRLGQYWVPDPLVRELRAEARQ